MERHLHIVCHDVPYPADYGGVFDIYYKIKALHRHGVLIHLHCFTYGREPQEILKQFCYSINYYQRKKGLRGFSLVTPYIVHSRRDAQLLNNLLADDYPILAEGIHSTGFLHDGNFQERKVFVRVFNIENHYYAQLSNKTSSLLKKIYFRFESSLLKKYEQQLALKLQILTLTEKDADWYNDIRGEKTARFLPVFNDWEYPLSKTGIGSFCLYHGNLSVPENEAAASWLLREVFKGLDIPLIIAGKKPSAALERLVKSHPGTCLVSDPSVEEMQELISKAQIHLLPSFSETGIKLKLLNAVFCGRHIIANKAMISSTNLETATHIAQSATEWKKMVQDLFKRPFGEKDIETRERLLNQYYNTKKNTGELIAWIW